MTEAEASALDAPLRAALEQLARDVVDYCNDPKLVAQARDALAEPPTGGTDRASALDVEEAKALLERWLYVGSMTRPDIDELEGRTNKWVSALTLSKQTRRRQAGQTNE